MVGWVFALSPSFLHEALNVHITQPVVGGLFATLVVFSSRTSQLILRRHLGPRATAVALCGIVLGMGIIAASSLATSLAVAIVAV